MENTNTEVVVSESSSLGEIIAKKQQLKTETKSKSNKPTNRFYLSKNKKDDNFKLTNSTLKETTYHPSFYDAITSFINQGEELLKEDILSRIWLYDKGSFRATLTLNSLKELVKDNTINENSSKLDISDERLKELLDKEEKLENLEEVVVENDLDEQHCYLDEIKRANEAKLKLDRQYRIYYTLLGLTWLGIVGVLVSLLYFIIKPFVG